MLTLFAGELFQPSFVLIIRATGGQQVQECLFGGGGVQDKE